MDKFVVTFQPYGKKIEIQRGEDILTAAVSAGVYINSSCGGDGVCGRCKVILRSGEVKTQPTGRLSKKERLKGYYLACLTSVQTDVEIEIPSESRLEPEAVSEREMKISRLKGIYEPQSEEVEQSKAVIEDGLFSHSPLATKLYLELPPPTLKDNISDLERLYREIRRIREIPIMQTGLTNIKRLGNILRESNWKVTVLLGKRNGTVEVVLIEPGDTADRNYGIVFDIGTTTVSGELVNLNTKKVLGTKSTYNKQVAFGSDVISRIIYTSEKDGLEKLHHAVVDNMNGIIESLILEHNINRNDLTCVTCAGNTTMVHLFLRVDPTYIRREPYVPTANFVPVIRASEAGIKTNPRGLLACIPGISSYVGGDITAGVLASGLDRTDRLTMLIDMGTNGEIVLGNEEWLVCCSASAGPAFEGSGVTCGMRAAKGAIQRVDISDTNYGVRVATIGSIPPRGICGSGYIDCVAEMMSKRIIDRNGRINTKIKSERIREGKDGLEFVLVFRGNEGATQDIVVTEPDIDNIKRSKGSIFAASSVLLRRLGLTFNDVQQFYVAGGFGTYLNMEKAITIGLLPDIPRDKFQFIGNSSLAGAREILLSYEAKRQAEEIARKMTYFELSVEPVYMDEYISALFFPHTDMQRFPSVVV